MGTLSKIAKKATHDIQHINRELTQPSATSEFSNDAIWGELHKEYNIAFHQSSALKESLLRQQPISASLSSFNSIISWIKTETERIEHQLEQFGYQQNQTTNYEYDLPLTPQQQIAYDEKIQIAQKQAAIKQSQNKEMDKNNQEQKKNTNNIAMDIDDDDNEDCDLQQHQESDKMPKTDTPKTSNNESENISNIATASSTISSVITPINMTRNSQATKKPIIQILTSPKTPALDEKYRLLCKTYRDQNNKNKPKEQSILSHPSSISTITPSISEFDNNAFRKKCGIPIKQSAVDQNERNVMNDSLGSIPGLPSPKVSLSQKYQSKNKENVNMKNGMEPITPFGIGQQDHSKDVVQESNMKTPLTVSSFAVKETKDAVLDDKDEDNDEMNVDDEESEDRQYGMSHLSENEFDGVPKWITNQLGTVKEINAIIDVVNKALKSLNGRINKSQFKDVIGANVNETPFILMLTRTNRLQTDWCQGNSLYCLKCLQFCVLFI